MTTGGACLVDGIIGGFGGGMAGRWGGEKLGAATYWASDWEWHDNASPISGAAAW